MARIQIVNESVVFQRTDAIVNAANATMLGGGGVDGAIHDLAGEELYAFFKEKRRMWKSGDVEISPGFGTNAKYILHAVGPIWSVEREHAEEKLRRCYIGCLEKANEAGCRSIAFCGISTGVYGYPLKAATRVALETVRGWLNEHQSNMLAKFCCYTALEYETYLRMAEEMGIL